MKIYDKVIVVSGHYDMARAHIGEVGVAVGRIPGKTEDDDLIAVCFSEEIWKQEKKLDEQYSTGIQSWNDCCFEGYDRAAPGIYEYYNPPELRAIE